MTTLAFALAATIKHDGHGGVADLLSTPDEAAAWLTEHDQLVAQVLGSESDLGRFVHPNRPETLPKLWKEVVRIRGAVRALFARAVAPGEPSAADVGRLMNVEDALRIVNEAADGLGTTHLEWVDEPSVRWAYRTEDPIALLVGAVGRSAIDFLASPDRARLRACPAARCVKYFLQDDPRQTWCSPACGNRERVNRHYRKRTSG
ncbi:CGNR zinc finger protein [Kribbella sp. VKM Ac-2569]|uniref:CGNR zinc finger domain-containing protein n=1 Tax=Kribbella sp. VKM Ac-2569 TaxID=2512220 RepID=UPI00102C5992|nr:ABATE domain-containing protein [Kribbella sp. VKM Ac-2569]RZT19882.1 CGNR zinc finger protein [Kribbella sp. VKM Ac-2569]